ncbi:MAG: SBBP repeat-containing protein, partial [Thermoplasmatota archaeon]
SNYFIGSREDWITDVQSYGEVVVQGIYEGTDARFYFTETGLKYDLILESHADLEDIRLRVEGIDELRSNGNKVEYIIDDRECIGDSDIIAFASDGSCIDASFRVLDRNVYGYDIPVRPHSGVMVIDPVIRSAFISGEGQDEVEKVLIGPDGSHYIGGVTSSMDFPVTPGAYQMKIDNTSGYTCNDLFVTKLNDQMNDIVFSTFIGGCDHEWLTGMELLEDGSIVIAGYTISNNFPNTTGAMDNTLDGYQDGFITRLSADGDALVYSSYFGGNNFDWIGSISVDDLGRTYVTGWTLSTDLPQTGGAENTSAISYLIYVAVVDTDGSSVLSSMILNSSDEQEACGIEYLDNGNVLVSGFTYNRSFQVTPGCIDSGINGTPGIDADLFLTEIDIWDHNIVRSGLIGGSIYDTPREVEVDGEHIWIAGITTSPDLPLTNDAFQRPACVDSVEWFIMKVDRNITTLEYSTYISGNRDEWDINVEMGDDGLLYICGKTWSSNITTTENAFDSSFNGSTDLVIMAFRASNMSLVHSTYLGGEGGDYVSSLIYTGNGTVAIGGYAIGDFPQGREHYINHSTTMPGFIIYYSLPVPPGPPENLGYTVIWEDDVYRINLSWDPPSEPGNGFPIEYEVGLIDRSGSQHVIKGFEGQTGTYLLLEEIEPPYEKKLFVTARSISGVSSPSDPVTIEERERPTFIDDLTQDSITADGDIRFTVIVADNWHLSEVQIEYWYDNGTFCRTIMEPSGPSVFRFTIFSKLVWGPVHYRFHASDVFGNVNITEDRQVDVFDLEPPIINDMTQKEAEYGDNITFMGSIEENSALEKITLNIISSSLDRSIDIPFDEDYYWTYVFEPPGDISSIAYVIKAVDFFGLESELEGNISIVDSTPPVMLEDRSDGQVRYHSDFNISASFWDLSGIASATLFYRIGKTGSWNEFTVLDTTHISFTVVLPWDETDPQMWAESMSVTYHLVVMDPWGNTFRTDNVTRGILDPVNIGSIERLHPPHGFTGDDFFFIVQMDDMAVVERVDIEIWIDESCRMREQMESTDEFPDHFSFRVMLPEDSLETIFYEVIVTIERIGELTFGPYNVTIYDGTPPTVPSIQDRTIGLGENIKVIVNAYDNIGIARYEWEGAPAEVGGNTLNWNADREGVYVIRVTAYDEAGNSASSTFTLTVKGEDIVIEPPLPEEGAESDPTSIYFVSIVLIAVIIIAVLFYVRRRKSPIKPNFQGLKASELPLVTTPITDKQDTSPVGSTDGPDRGSRHITNEGEDEGFESDRSS